MKARFLIAGFVAAAIGLIVLDFFLTKSALEDVAGKEVSTFTVLWTMMKMK